MNANFRGKGASPPTIFGNRKVESLSYRMVKKIAEKFNRLSRVHQRHRQTDNRQTTDRQTDRQTTDGRLIAYSERNVVRSLKSFKCSESYNHVLTSVNVLAYRLGSITKGNKYKLLNHRFH